MGGFKPFTHGYSSGGGSSGGDQEERQAAWAAVCRKKREGRRRAAKEARCARQPLEVLIKEINNRLGDLSETELVAVLVLVDSFGGGG